MKSGKERRAKRKTRKGVENAIVRATDGDHWLSTTKQEDYQNRRLVGTAVKNRWLTSDPPKTQEEAKTPKEIAMLVTVRGMLSPDQDIAISHIRNFLLMEGQNIEDAKIRSKEWIEKLRMASEASRPHPEPHLHLHRLDPYTMESQAVKELVAMDLQEEEDSGTLSKEDRKKKLENASGVSKNGRAKNNS